MKWHATQPRARGKKLECGVGSRVKCDLYGVELRLSAAIGWELSERQGIWIFVGCDDGRFLQIPKSRATAGESSLESLRPCPSAPWRSLYPVTGAAQSHRLHLVHHLLHHHLHDIEATCILRLWACGVGCRGAACDAGTESTTLAAPNIVVWILVLMFAASGLDRIGLGRPSLPR